MSFRTLEARQYFLFLCFALHMVCCGALLNACLFPGCITIRNQEAIPCTVTQVPPWQRRWWGHFHENCQSLCCVSVIQILSFRGKRRLPSREPPDYSICGEVIIHFRVLSPQSDQWTVQTELGNVRQPRWARRWVRLPSIPQPACSFVLVDMLSVPRAGESASWSRSMLKGGGNTLRT